MSRLNLLFKLARHAPWLALLVVVALLAPLLANNKPIVCKYQGRWYLPALIDFTGSRHYYQTQHPLRNFALNQSWQKDSFSFYLSAPIPYHANQRDPQHTKVPPGTQQHWLGTDASGHDVAAGLVSGTRVALSISLLAVLAAAVLGISIGAIAGYFGDRQLSISLWHLTITLPLLLLLTLCCWTIWHQAFRAAPAIWLSGWCAAALLVCFFSAFGKSHLPTHSRLHRTVAIPIDLLTQRLGEIISAFPKLILLTVLAAMLNSNPSIYFIALVAGAFSWPSIAAYVRAEMLKVRSLNYVAAARMLGISELRTLFRHALPNAIAPAWVALAFFAGSAILLETSLSFLGIRDHAETVSWGSLMLDARLYPTAWWLAIFPGLMISLTIYTLYSLAMRVSQRHVMQ